MKKHVHHTLEERKLILDRAAQLFNESMGLGYMAMNQLITQAQIEAIPDPARHRTVYAAFVTEMGKKVRERAEQLRKEAESLKREEQKEEEKKKEPVTLTPPPIPSRLGLDPRFAEAAVYFLDGLCRSFGETFGAVMGEKIGAAVGKGVRDAIYDIKNHMGTPRDYDPRDVPAPKEVPASPPVPDPLEKFRKPKFLVIGLNPDQRQVLLRTVPNADWRFVEHRRGSAGSAALKQTKALSKTCDAAFVMTKFVSHSQDGLLDSSVAKIPVHGVVQDLVRIARIRFPNLNPHTEGERHMEELAARGNGQQQEQHAHH